MKVCKVCKQAKPETDYYRNGAGYLQGKCKPCFMIRTKAYYRANHAKIRPAENAKMVEVRKRVKDAVFAAYGGYICACCGETEKAFLTLDHVNNDGSKHRREVIGKRYGAGFQTYSLLAKTGFPSGFQVLCMNCNWGKRLNGVCPHKVRCNDYPQGAGPSGPERSTPVLTLIRGRVEDIVSPTEKSVAVV